MRVELAGMPLEIALRRGLGRAILFLEEQTDCRPYRELLTEACFLNWAYDSAIEDNRSVFLWDAIHATGEPEYYLARLREPLENQETGYAWSQIFRLAAMFIRNGDTETKDLLYQIFPDMIPDGRATLSECLIRLDGLSGYLYIAEIFAQQGDKIEEWEHSAAINILAATQGEATPENTLAMVSTLRPDLAEYIQNASASRKVLHRRSTGRISASTEEPVTYEMVRQIITTPSSDRHIPYFWARNLDDVSCQRLAQDMVAETDLKRLECYLSLFNQRAPRYPFPGDLHILFPLLYHEDLLIRWYTAQILRDITHPDLRPLALDLLQTPHLAIHGLTLLPSNPGDGDLAHFHQRLPLAKNDTEQEEIIILCLDYLHRRIPEGSDALLLEMYQESPCGVRRLSTLQRLNQISGSLPEWVIAEARYDAYPPTRQFVESIAPIPTRGNEIPGE